MNERIKELILECVDFRLDPDSNAYEAQVCPEELECLVELIVRECMGITDKCSTGPGLHDLFADKIIAEHFGVEE